jgi:hypothetical protein
MYRSDFNRLLHIGGHKPRFGIISRNSIANIPLAQPLDLQIAGGGALYYLESPAKMSTP